MKNAYPLILVLLVVSSCGQRRNINVDESVRNPSTQSDSNLQIQPLIPEAVKTLIAEAQQHQAAGQDQLAILALKRALQITPDSPLVQQELAEAWLAQGDYQQAFNWSNQVAEFGPEFGPLCERSRRTLALAAELLGDVVQQAEALEAIATCQQQGLQRF